MLGSVCAIGSVHALQPLKCPACYLKWQEPRAQSPGYSMELTASHGCDVNSANPPASVAPDEETDPEGQVTCSSVQPPTPELT